MFSACSGEEQPIQSGQDKENTEPSVVSDLLCEEVYVEETEGLKPYIVASTDYNGTTLLLRKYVLNEQRRMNDHYSSYENCEMDKFLNTEYYDSFPEKTKEIILETEIESCQRDHMWASRPLKSNLIKRKIFLLSGTETNNDDIVVAPTEGKVLDYFNVNRGEYFREHGHYKYLTYTEGGTAQSWWTRTPCTSENILFYYFDFEDGSMGISSACYESSVRPAFCISNDTPIEKTDISGESVYVIKY